MGNRIVGSEELGFYLSGLAMFSTVRLHVQEKALRQKASVWTRNSVSPVISQVLVVHREAWETHRVAVFGSILARSSLSSETAG